MLILQREGGSAPVDFHKIMNKNWVIKASGNEEAIASLASELGIDRPLAQLLTQRNINTYQEAKDFFRPDLANLHDPFLMKDMDLAIQRIQEAIQAGEKVMIYGDYDADGVTSVSILYDSLFIQYLRVGFSTENREKPRSFAIFSINKT